MKDLSKADLNRIYEICVSNPEYYQHMNENLSLKTIERLLIALPPTADIKNKKNIGFFMNNRLIGYLEMVQCYPDLDTVLIGFFVLEKTLQGKGLGSLIMKNLFNLLEKKEFKSVILSCPSTNEASLGFWKKIGFIQTEENEIFDDIELVIMEKFLV
ncbi:hypothetical protein BRY75_13525 [Acinetobacter baumannii]|uniref:GNAT family N-acetyltransferase n=1 Tax=Acinetobacter baumannii TaxID=470 RepID=UPI0009268CE9|nr:GNAT family N-acetyltransferase [Acinetobacter baumannii]OJK06329.1 hypothetical protein BRY75_13525 [Acinetobacter baumannii]